RAGTALAVGARGLGGRLDVGADSRRAGRARIAPRDGRAVGVGGPLRRAAGGEPGGAALGDGSRSRSPGAGRSRAAVRGGGGVDPSVPGGSGCLRLLAARRPASSAAL